MATAGNREWAYAEAARRAHALDGPYSIYRHKYNPDYIIRTRESAPPNPERWRLVATYQPDGKLSFAADDQ